MMSLTIAHIAKTGSSRLGRKLGKVATRQAATGGHWNKGSHHERQSMLSSRSYDRQGSPWIVLECVPPEDRQTTRLVRLE